MTELLHTFADGRISVRWVRGRKGDPEGKRIDLRMDLLVPRWTAVPFEVVGHMAHGLYMNEDRLYPRPRFRGGELFLDAMVEAMREGPEGVRWSE